jgi:DNA-binding protein YbaB
MKECKRYRIGAESGVSLSGLIVVLIVLGALALVAIKVTPALFEYRAVKESIVKAKKDAVSGSVREVQQAFDKNAGVNDVSAINGRDLVITRDGGDLEISFSYEKRIPLAGNVSLLFDFSGTTDPSGVVAAKAESK